MPKTNGESFIQLDFGWFCRGFNSCSRDRSSSQPVVGRVLKVWKIFTTYCVGFFFKKTFSSFFCDIYCHTLLIGQRPPFICLNCFVVNVFFPTSKAYKHLPYSNYININSKGLTWYGFKTVFYTTRSCIYVCGIT